MSEVKTVEMAINESGTFALDTLDRQMAYAQSLMAKGLISETYKNPSQVVLAIQMARVVGIEPLMALKQSYVVNGKPAFFGDLPLAIVVKSGQLESIEEFFVNEKIEKICVEAKNIKDKPFAAVCRVKRRGDPVTSEFYFSIDEAGTAGLLRSPVWNKYQKTMLQYRARTMALKGKFAESLNGFNIAEYDTIGVDEKENEQERVARITGFYSNPNSDSDQSITASGETDIRGPGNDGN